MNPSPKIEKKCVHANTRDIPSMDVIPWLHFTYLMSGGGSMEAASPISTVPMKSSGCATGANIPSSSGMMVVVVRAGCCFGLMYHRSGH